MIEKAQNLNLTSMLTVPLHVYGWIFQRCDMVGCKLHKPNDYDLSLNCKQRETSTDLRSHTPFWHGKEAAAKVVSGGGDASC